MLLGALFMLSMSGLLLLALALGVGWQAVSSKVNNVRDIIFVILFALFVYCMQYKILRLIEKVNYE
tara:strand:- start:121 stop:318 length:198 start_codon:yes stop_codon:yes gene_type:complete